MARNLGSSATTSNLWVPTVQPVAQVTAFVLAGTWEATDLIKTTINGREYESTVTSTTIDTLGAAYIAELNALSAATYPEHARVTWSYNSSSDSIIATVDEAGVPLTITLSTRDAGGVADAQTIDGGATSTGTNSTTATSKNHINDADNWSLSAIPINDDEMVFADCNVDVSYGLTALAAVTVDTFRWDSTMTGKGGLPRYNAYGNKEGQQRFIQIVGSADCNVIIGDGDGSGPNFLNLDCGSGQVVCDVIGTGRASHDFAFTFLGTNASNTMSVSGGSVGICPDAGQVSTVATLRITHNPRKSRPFVHCGAGATLTTISNSGGDLHTESGATTVTIDSGGTWEHLNGAVTTVHLDGVLYLNSDGTITTLNVYENGVVDLSRSGLALAVTNLKLWKGATVIDPLGLISSFAPVLQGCALKDVKITRPKNKTYTES